MKIEKTETFILQVPTGRKLKTAIHDITDVYNVFIKLSSGGVDGYGYAFAFSEAQAYALKSLMDDLGSVIVGSDGSVGNTFEIAKKRFNFVGDLGPAMLARSALDVAAWDLLSKSLDAPLYKVLGGSPKPLAVYATGGWVTYTMQETVSEAEMLYSAGYRRYKIKMGGRANSFADDLKRAKELRDNVPDDLEIMVDANQAWDTRLALEAAQKFSQEGFVWFEEPIPADDVSGHARLTSETEVKIAAGETLHGFDQLMHLVDAGGVDVLMPDVMRVGGVSGFKRVLEATEGKNVVVSSHTLTGVSTHIMSLSKLGGPVEVLPTWWDDVFSEKPNVVDGTITPGQAAGAGTTPCPDAVERWLV